jgi:tripartite-type tricarboxylate transporter receptor subunit TctC
MKRMDSRMTIWQGRNEPMPSCRRLIATALLTLLAFLVVNAEAQAQSPEEFYRGKQVKMIVGHPVGGDYDVGTRLLAKYLPKYIPGNPSVIVQNMLGASSIVATNAMYNVEPKDGTVIGSFSRNVPTEAVLGQANLKADPRKFNWIGATSLPSRVCVSWFTSNVKNAKDVFERALIVPGGGPTSAMSLVPTVLNHVLGAKFRIVQGYRGFPGGMLAMERGEVEGICNTYSQIAAHTDLVRDRKINFLFHTEEAPLADRPDLASIYPFAKTDEQAQVIRFVFSNVEFGRPYVFAPGVPADRVSAMRTAFKAAVADPELVTEAAKAKLDMSWRSPEALAALVDKLYATPPKALAVIKKLVH